MLGLRKEKERIIHVSGRETKEELGRVIDVVEPEKLIIHYTVAGDDEKSVIRRLLNTEMVRVADGMAIVL